MLWVTITVCQDQTSAQDMSGTPVGKHTLQPDGPIQGQGREGHWKVQGGAKPVHQGHILALVFQGHQLQRNHDQRTALSGSAMRACHETHVGLSHDPQQIKI